MLVDLILFKTESPLLGNRWGYEKSKHFSDRCGKLKSPTIERNNKRHVRIEKKQFILIGNEWTKCTSRYMMYP